jgi:glycerol uptake facilitator-like aquaporin
MSNRIAPKLLAEFIGTFAFVFIGAGAAAVVGEGVGMPGIVAIAFAHGLAIMALAFAYGSVSGGHFNPAVTVGVLAAGAMGVGEAIGYIISQLIGGVVGALLLRTYWGERRQASARLYSRTTSLWGPRPSRSRPLPAS